MSHTEFGSPATNNAPDATVYSLAGAPVQLSSMWKDRPAVLVFLRYFGCPFCQLQVGRMAEDRDKFDRAGANVVLIGHQEQDSARFGEAFRPFTYLYDADRSAYKAFGLERGSLLQVTGPRVALSFAKANLDPATRQRKLNGGDYRQLPGTFVVDTRGVTRMAHRNLNAADNPSNESILEVLDQISARVPTRA